MSEFDFESRIRFLPDLNIMDIDLSNLTLESSRDVDAFYDIVEDLIHKTATTWYFLVNYENCRINPGAWPQFELRRKRVNLDLSKGNARYAPAKNTKKKILEQSGNESFNSGLFTTRDEALARIEEMKNTIPV